MGDSRALPGFGQVDLDLEDDDGETPACGILAATLPPAAFGHLDFDAPNEVETVPPSASRVFGTPKGDSNTHPTRRSMASVHDESTRIVRGDALSNITRPLSAAEQDGNPRAWIDVVDIEEDAQAESGGAARDERVAPMRELYAKGDAEGALALATGIGDILSPARGGADHPDPSIFVELCDEEDISDPFGGLIPLAEDEDPGPLLAPLPARTPVPCAAPQLTLTERHSIPSVLKSAREVSKLPIDHRAGFLLAHVDGTQTLEEILDVCAMPANEALQLIAKLKEMGVIEFE